MCVISLCIKQWWGDWEKEGGREVKKGGLRRGNGKVPSFCMSLSGKNPNIEVSWYQCDPISLPFFSCASKLCVS